MRPVRWLLCVTARVLSASAPAVLVLPKRLLDAQLSVAAVLALFCGLFVVGSCVAQGAPPHYSWQLQDARVVLGAGLWQRNCLTLAGHSSVCHAVWFGEHPKLFRLRLTFVF
jgi:hypothetical protein